ncbi:restriction endonuclease subunit S [Bacteroides gallinaceum]|uniref:Restriction endonuclease subunit S n=1 Tax=Bacteroides gallinaceum TaxID=1462571 RepID=A0ABT7VDL8_9BACE|nr:restriction endonuclease subunit S [Bacteroides gallinaceum]MDM8324383.1 restriction endonuclease subunit S [Bacteroides gallinaceum]
MKNKEKTELIPELRFGGFPIKNWDEKKLQDIFIYLSTNTYSRNLLNNRQGIYQNIHYGDILVKYGSIIDAQKEEIPYINEDIECTTDNIIMDGDIVIADTAEDEIVGKTSEIFNIGDKKILSGLHTFWLRPLISFAPKYLGYFFNSTQYHNQLLPLIQGAKVSSISKKALNNTIIVYPSISEQQKIADCLSSLDELIEATAQKVEALKEHKKGLMQRLFPAEGKNVPDLRFPEYQRTQVWEDAILGTVADYENGKAHENEIDEDGDFIVVNSKFISTDGEVIKRTNTPYCLADKEDILMVLSDVPNGRAIAKCFFVDESGKYTVNQRICRLRSKSINSKFLFYLINRNPYFLSFDDGVKQTNLKKSEVLECPLMIPSSPIEQQKIADLLSSIDDLIIATEQRIKSLEKHKKGLMQQLFPKI